MKGTLLLFFDTPGFSILNRNLCSNVKCAHTISYLNVLGLLTDASASLQCWWGNATQLQYTVWPYILETDNSRTKQHGAKQQVVVMKIRKHSHKNTYAHHYLQSSTANFLREYTFVLPNKENQCVIYCTVSNKCDWRKAFLLRISSLYQRQNNSLCF